MIQEYLDRMTMCLPEHLKISAIRVNSEGFGMFKVVKINEI
jgi:hypothetical protein